VPQYLHGRQSLHLAGSGNCWHSHLADELATKGIDDTCDRRSLALADVVEVEHALDGTRLETAMVAVSLLSLCQVLLAELPVLPRRCNLLDETSRLGVEECVFEARAHGPARRSETLDVVVCAETVLSVAVKAAGTIGHAAAWYS